MIEGGGQLITKLQNIGISQKGDSFRPVISSLNCMKRTLCHHSTVSANGSLPICIFHIAQNLSIKCLLLRRNMRLVNGKITRMERPALSLESCNSDVAVAFWPCLITKATEPLELRGSRHRHTFSSSTKHCDVPQRPIMEDRRPTQRHALPGG